MKKKVLHILSSGNLAGAEKVTIDIIENTSEQFESFYLSPEGNIDTFLSSKCISYIPVSKLTPMNIRLAVKRIKPDLIHAHDFTASVMVSFTIFSVKVVSHIHQNPPWLLKLSFPSILYLLSCFRYKSLIFVSDWIFENRNIYNFLFKKKIYVIENYVDLELIKNKSLEASTLDFNQFDLIFVGRLSEVKDPIRFIKIVKKVTNYLPNIKAAIVGDGLLYMNCEEEIKSNELEDNVKLFGFQENPWKFIRNAKVQVITSKWEGFGLVAVEALALGKPVIASRVGGLNKIVKSKIGSLCASDDEFVESIVTILKLINEGKSFNYECNQIAQKFGNKKKWLDKIMIAMK